MKLLRFALLTFDPPPENWREWRLRADGARIQTEWARELEAGKLSVLVIAETDLSERPVVNDDGLVIIPEDPLKRAEAMIETSANLVAVFRALQAFHLVPGSCCGLSTGRRGNPRMVRRH
jgi:acetyl-CoA acetyltransferase